MAKWESVFTYWEYIEKTLKPFFQTPTGQKSCNLWRSIPRSGRFQFLKIMIFRSMRTRVVYFYQPYRSQFVTNLILVFCFTDNQMKHFCFTKTMFYKHPSKRGIKFNNWKYSNCSNCSFLPLNNFWKYSMPCHLKCLFAIFYLCFLPFLCIGLSKFRRLHIILLQTIQCDVKSMGISNIKSNYSIFVYR